MNEKYTNFIGMYDPVFPDGFCDHLIESFEVMCSKGLCSTRKQSESVAKNIKDDVAFSLNLYNHVELGSYNGSCSRDIIVNSVQKCFDAYTSEYDILSNSDIHCTSFKLQRTDPGGGYHVWHAEQNNDSQSNRCLFYLMYLNDIDSAGETEFLYQRLRIPPKKNTCIISPASFTHAHRGNPVYGEKSKYVVTGWFYLS